MNFQKILSVLLLTIFSISMSIGQDNNEYISETELNNNPSLEFPEVELYNSTQTGEISFEYVQNIAAYEYDADEPVKLVVSLLNIRPENGVLSLHGFETDHFDWQYEASINSFLGVQKKDLYKDFRMKIEIDVYVETVIPCGDNNKMGFNANIQPAPKMNGVNITADDSVSEYGCLEITSTHELEEDWVSIQPNPFYNVFNIERISEKEDLDVKVFNASGKLVKSLRLHSYDNARSVNFDNEEGGVYLIQISDSKSTQTTRLIKVN